MSTASFHVFNDSHDDIPFDRKQLIKIIDLLEKHEVRNFANIEVVFVRDSVILELNREYLGHDYITDIITFPYHEVNAPVEGTLFCCAPQIRRQSNEIGSEYETEILRVVIHGLLHLVGYNDSTDHQREYMQTLENKYITLLQGS